MSFRLPRLPMSQPPWSDMQMWWQEVVEAIEQQEGVQDQALADIQTALTNAGIAIGLANSGIALTQAITAANAAPPPSGGTGGGTSASSNALASFNTATHAVVSPVLTVTAGAAGTVTLTASNLAVTTAAELPVGTYPVLGKWQWDSTGADVWVDVGIEDVGGVAAEVESFGGGYFGVNPGSLDSNEAKTGLTPATVHKFRFMARNQSGTRTMYLTGTVSGVGS